jgi:hypothetical protein
LYKEGLAALSAEPSTEFNAFAFDFVIP